MNDIATSTVRLSRHYDASPERVFNFWFDSEKRSFFSTQSGHTIRLERDGESESSCRVILLEKFPGTRGTITTMYTSYLKVQIERPRRLVFDFPGPSGAPLNTHFTIEIAPATEGCELTLTLEGILEANRIHTAKMWCKELDWLDKQLAEN